MSEQRDFDLMVLPASALAMRRPKQKQNGYAALPGSGPAGETCGSCANMVRKELSRSYLKCALMSAHWTGGAGSDVRSKSPACRRWDAPLPEPKHKMAP